MSKALNTTIILIIVAVAFFLTYKALNNNNPGNEGIVIGNTIKNEPIKPDEIAEKMLIAINLTDYNSYTSQFSETLKLQLPEKGFESLSKLITNTSGRYLSKELVSNKAINDYNIFIYNASFEKEIVTFEIHLSNSATVVEAVKISSDNLKKLQNHKTLERVE